MTNNECIHETIDRNIIESAEDFVKRYGEDYNLQQYFFLVLSLFSLKIYEAAPSCVDAEKLINEAVRQAKETFLEE